jgi:tRNA 5-methylaminomethyl-2-thiouridine biosynthesis bifunctional protein
VFSVEGYTLGRDDAARALAAWPSLADLAAPLLAQWPGGRRGFHRIEWADCGVILDLAVMEVEAALTAWSGRADAWFLDGFAPAKNPQMWRPEVLALLAARSRSGAPIATFTVAGAVRRGLEAAGFEVRRAPGFGGKKQRLEGRLALQPELADSPSLDPPKRIAVVGAGIAGAALARAFRRLGADVQVIEGEGPGAGGSGNPAALVTPRLDAGLGADADLHAQAFARAAQLYRWETPGAIIAESALQLSAQPRDAARFQKIAAWDGFDPGEITCLDAAQAAAVLNEAAAPSGLRLRDGLVVEPRIVLDAWLPDALVPRHVERLEPAQSGWRLIDGEGRAILEADVVCLAGGPASTRLVAALPLRPVRGQATIAELVAFSGVAAAWGGYAIPTRDGVLFGATHARDDWSTDLRPQDDAQNLHDLALGRPALAERLAGAALSARASLRAMSPDHKPLAGAVRGRSGVFVLSGFGGRGFALAPLLAEAVAALALGAPSPLPQPLQDLVDPARFGQP